ncbi:zinc knuckle [Apiospora kogelbergensis]|uniref:zinc knuckle n=1 Tax=Apiospora kogelbergensis TaxID=1337665 RepID=UPI0031323052
MASLFRDPKTTEYHIIAIQEPWINKNEYNSHNPMASIFTLWLPPAGLLPPGVAFYVNKRLDQSCISFAGHSSNVASLAITYVSTATAALTTIPASPITDTSINTMHIYNPLSTLRELAVVLRRNKTQHPTHEHIILGDFNMEGREWAVEDLGDRGSARQGLPYFREFLEKESLEIILPPGTITREENASQSTIDLAICDRIVADKLVHCKIAVELNHDSDHLPIRTVLQLQPPPAPPRPPRKLFRNTPVKEFLTKLAIRLPKMPSGRLTNDDVLRTLGQVTEALSDTIEDTVPTADSKTRFTSGFSAECKAICTRTNKLRRTWQRTRTSKDWEAYRKSRNEKGAVVQKAIKESWQMHVTKACSEGTGKALWDLVKGTKSQGQGVAKQNVTPTIDGQDTFDEKADAFKKGFFPTPSGIPQAPRDKLSFSTEIPCPPFTKDEVKRSLTRPSHTRHPDPQGYLTTSSASRGICPSKDSITLVLKKPQKPDYSLSKAYRPIALLDTIPKALESAVAERVSYWVEEFHLLPEVHIGARKTRSTEHAIHILLERIYEAHGAANSGEYLVATLLMLDASGAFNNVHHDKLVECLARRGLPSFLVMWISTWLRNRRTKLKLPEGESDWIEQNFGIPQGSSLSPLLWLFYNADLLDEILAGENESKGIADDSDSSDGSYRTSGTEGSDARKNAGAKGPRVTTTAWVDDTGILVIGKSAAENCRTLERVHGKAALWATKYGCVFDPDKYEVIHFRTKKERKASGAAATAAAAVTAAEATTAPTAALPEECVQIPGFKAIVPVDKLRHLGVWFDPGLLWHHHIAHIKTKVRTSIQALRSLTGSVWGCGTLQLRQLYQAIIVPQITYCSTVWFQPYDEKAQKQGITKKHLEALRDIQKEALLVVTGGLKTSAVLAMATEMHVLPIEQQLLQANHMAYLRLRSHPLMASYGKSIHDTRRKARWKSPLTQLIQYHEKFHQGLPPLEVITPFVVPPWWRRVSTVIGKSEKEGKAHHDHIVKTFGAKIDIFTDNQAAILSSAWPERQSGQWLLRQIAKQITTLRQRKIDLHIHWIPAHTGVPGNERADELAKAGAEAPDGPARRTRAKEVEARTAREEVDKRTRRTRKPRQPRKLRVPDKAPITNQSPRTTLAAQRMLAKKTTKTRWESEWLFADSGRVLHRHLPKPEKSTLLRYRDQKRAVSATIFQMRTGKIGLRDYLWMIQRTDSPLCDCGNGDRQTLRHVLLDCKKHRRLREEVWSGPRSGWKAPQPPKSIKEIWKSQRAKTAAIFMLHTGLLGRFTRDKVEDDPPKALPKEPPQSAGGNGRIGRP